MVLHITRTCIGSGDIVFLKSVYIDEEYRRFFDSEYYDLFRETWEDEVREKIGVEILDRAPVYLDGSWYKYTVQLENTHNKIHTEFKDYRVRWVLE